MAEIKKWPRFSEKKANILKQMFLAGESMNVDNFVKFFTDDATYQFSNNPTVYGPEGIKSSSVDFLKKVEGIHHHLMNIWEVGDNEMVVDMEVTYIRHDGKVFTLPCCDIIRLKGNKVQELYIYMDISPVFTTPEIQKETSIEKKFETNLIDIVKRLFELALANDLDTYVTLFTEDAIYKAGNYEPAIGKKGIREFATPVMERFKTVDHEIKNIWQKDNTVIAQVVVVYNRNDGKVFKIPVTNIIRFKGDKIHELRAFGDNSPAFS